MNETTKPFKVHLTADERAQIEAAKNAAGYKSLSAYIRDSALKTEKVDVQFIAREIGRLGQIVNGIILEGHSTTGDGPIHGDEAKKVARKIIKACDAVSDVMRRR